MNDWIHCNKCSHKKDSNMKLFLTECGHLFCEKCVTNLRDSKCIVCQKSTKTIPVTKDMDPSIQQYFMPLESHMKKLIEVYNFQMQHRASHAHMLIQKYNYAKKECISMHNKVKNMAMEMKMMRAMLMQSAEQNKQQPFLTSTPVMKPDMTPMDNMSGMSSIGFTPSIRAGAATGPGFVQRIFSSGDGTFRRPQFIPQPSSGGSSMTRSCLRVVPTMKRKTDIPSIHSSTGSSFSMEQLRRAGHRS